MADPSPRHPTRWGMIVRAPPLGHRVPTYPQPPRPGRRVSTVCVPCRQRRTTTGPASSTKRRRVMVDPPPRHLARWGMTVRAPPPGHRVPTYPRPTTARAPGQYRLSAVAIATVPSPAGPRRLRQGVLAPRPCQSPHPKQLANLPNHRGKPHPQAHFHPPKPHPQQHVPPSPHGGEGPGVRPTLHPRCRAGDHNPPTKRILPSKYRPIRGLAPPRPRASPITTPPAPHPRPPAEDLPVPAHSPLATW